MELICRDCKGPAILDDQDTLCDACSLNGPLVETDAIYKGTGSFWPNDGTVVSNLAYKGLGTFDLLQLLRL